MRFAADLFRVEGRRRRAASRARARPGGAARLLIRAGLLIRACEVATTLLHVADVDQGAGASITGRNAVGVPGDTGPRSQAAVFRRLLSELTWRCRVACAARAGTLLKRSETGYIGEGEDEWRSVICVVPETDRRDGRRGTRAFQGLGFAWSSGPLPARGRRSTARSSAPRGTFSSSPRTADSTTSSERHRRRRRRWRWALERAQAGARAGADGSGSDAATARLRRTLRAFEHRLGSTASPSAPRKSLMHCGARPLKVGANR